MVSIIKKLFEIFVDRECKLIKFSKIYFQEKKEGIWLSPMTKAPTPTEKSKELHTWQHKNATKNFHYTTIADQLRTVN